MEVIDELVSRLDMHWPSIAKKSLFQPFWFPGRVDRGGSAQIGRVNIQVQRWVTPPREPNSQAL
jgi:hypothetical protein